VSCKSAERAWRAYLGITAILGAGAALRGLMWPHLLFLLSWSVVLGWPVARALRSNLPRLAVLPVVVVVGYHALFGPAMLLHFLTRDATRNDDLALRTWPHVIHWINSFE